MENTFASRLKHAWNAFMNRDPTFENYGSSSSTRPDRVRLVMGNERSIVTSIYNRIAMDVAAINVQHVQLDDQGRFLNVRDSSLNECLTVSANVDQTGKALIQDIAMSLLDEGCVAVVPVDTQYDPYKTDSYSIETLRVGKVLEWYPSHVKVRLYDERDGTKKDIITMKRFTAIIENPFYAVMNEPNSTARRLSRKLSLLDVTDEQTASGKLDLIIQLPYAVKTKLKEEQAESRRQAIEDQLVGSKYGIAYIDGTEHITQLNRPVENSLMVHVQYLTEELMGQLGMTKEILNGTASDSVMTNYYSRTIEPILSAIVEEMRRKFLTKTARSQGQSIMFFRDPFKLVPLNTISEIADKFTRNEILTSNEIRQRIGINPSSDPKADQLMNSNVSHSPEELAAAMKTSTTKNEADEEENQNG